MHDYELNNVTFGCWFSVIEDYDVIAAYLYIYIYICIDSYKDILFYIYICRGHPDLSHINSLVGLQGNLQHSKTFIIY